MKNKVIALFLVLNFSITISAMESKELEKVFLGAFSKMPQEGKVAFQEQCITPGKNDSAVVCNILSHQLPLISAQIEQSRSSSNREDLKTWQEWQENCKKAIEALQEPSKELNHFELLFASNKVYELIPTIYKSYLDFILKYRTNDLALTQQLEIHRKALEIIKQKVPVGESGNSCSNQ